jgi:hypothetical protein
MTNVTTPPTQADLDDIMSSIRTGVEAESGKPPSGSADLVEQAAAEALGEGEADATPEGVANGDDDILELTPAELVSTPADSAAEAADEVITPANDVAANVSDILGVPALTAADEAADEFDKLLAEISEEKKTRAADVAAEREALLADIEPLGDTPVAAEAVAEDSPANTVVPMAADLPAAASTRAEAIPDALATVLPAAPAGSHVASLAVDANGLPANLAPITEKLVQAEIAKLNAVN